MKIERITENKRDYMDMLLLADPQENMIERYLDDGDMFVLFDDGAPMTVSVVLRMRNRSCELKNIATREGCQRQGYGKYMIGYICEYYSSTCDMMYVGTGNCKKTLGFYEKCGFVNSHIIENYFLNQYDKPIYEDGVQLKDMVYLKKKLDSEIDVKKVVALAVEAGSLLLQNGGEIFRVEETIRRICDRFHVEDVELFTLSHAIFISAGKEEEGITTKVKQVPLSSANMEIVAEVNALSREISAGHVGLEDAAIRLKEIEKIPSKPEGFQVVAAGMASGAFAILLGSTITESVVAFCIGCILYVWMLFAKKWNLSKMIMNIVGGIIMTAVAIFAMNVSHSAPLRLEGMITGAIMPLIPGVAFVNAIRDIADSDFLSGTVRMIDALLVFVYIAVGVGVTLAVFRGMAGGLII